MASTTSDTRPRRKRLRPEQRRELIVAAAADEFGRRGFRAARLSDIAEAAGTTKAVIYDHFAHKQALHEEVLRFTVREFGMAVAAAVTSDKEPRDRLRDGFEAYIRFCVERPCARVLLERDPTAGTEVAQAQSHAQANAADAGAAIWLREPAFLGDREDRAERARQVVHAVIGALTAIAGAPRMSVEAKTDLAMDLLEPGLREMLAG